MAQSARLLFGVALVANVFALGPAHAGPVTALEALREYNLIVFDDFRLTQDIQGAVYVGGNLTGGNMVGANFGSYTGATGLTVAGDVMVSNLKVKNSDLYVGGNVVSGLVEIQDGGSAYVGGTAAPDAIRLNGNPAGRTIETGSTRPQDKLLDVADFLALSSALASREAEVRYSSADILDPNNFRITVADLDGDGVAVVSLEAGFLDSLSSYGLYGDGIAGLDTIIINVGGTHISIGANWQTGGLPNSLFASEHVIWNFYEAEVLTFDRQIFGSVLAPGARVSNVTPIDGTLVAGSFTQNGQVHWPGYRGTLITFDPPPVEIAAPASAGVLGLGLAGLVFVQRRRPEPGRLPRGDSVLPAAI
ncbi:collagen-binding domain-containing protein [Pedomonas sp. V897]|uniref:collagen-binding domain-containing protein n=1 Tax=Pedomonas sp. V897 TaxID=3446482 RepID=UPI003EE09291